MKKNNDLIEMNITKKKTIKNNQKKKLNSKITPFRNKSSSDKFLIAEDLIQDSDDSEDLLGTAEELLNRAEEIIDKEKELPEIRPNNWEGKKDMNENMLLKENNFDIKTKRCPLCNSRLKKGKVIKKDNILNQVIKCKNKNCAFVREIRIIL